MRSALALTIAVVILGLTGCRSAQHYLRQGDQLFADHKYADAVLAYRNALKKDGRSAETFYKLGLVQRAINDVPGAVGSFTRATALNPEFADARAELGDLYLGAYLLQSASNSGLYYKVLETSGWLLKKDPRSFPGLRLRGYLALSDKNPEEALSYFRRANEIRPAQTDISLNITRTLLMNGQSEEGRKLGHELIQRNKSFGPIYDVLYGYEISVGHAAEAEALLKQKVANNPGNQDFMLQLAAHYWRAGDKDAASKLLDGVLTAQSRWDAYVLVARFYKSFQQWDRALAVLDQGLSRYSGEKSKYREEKAGVLMAAGKTQDAIQTLDQLLREEPAASSAKKMRAVLLLGSPEKQNRERALQDLQSMTGGPNDDPALLFQLGRAYALNGKPDQAKQTLELALHKNRRDVASLLAMAELTSESKQFQQSLQYSERALAVNPDFAGARLVHATALVGVGRLEEARTDLMRVAQNRPEYVEARLQLALLDVVEKRYSEAEKLFRDAYRPKEGDFRALKGLVEMYAAQNEWDKALTLVQSEAGRFPEMLGLQQLLASTADRAGRPAIAIQQYKAILQRRQNDPAIYTALGELYDKQHDLPNAVAALTKAHDLAPKDWRTTGRLAVVQEEAGMLSEAKANYRQAINLGADTPDLLNNLAYVEARTGSDLEDALVLTKRALSNSPSNPQYADTLGFVYLKQKKFASAVDVFRGLSVKHPENATFRYHLALALFNNGDSAGCRRELKAALAADPSLLQASKQDLPGIQ